MNHNSIYQKSQQPQSQLVQDSIIQDKTTAQTINQCRICLQAQNFEVTKNRLISPCKCTGSLRLVHSQCLEEWISKIVNKSGKKIQSGKAHISCQICKSKIQFKTCKQLKCKTKQQIIIGFKQNIKTFLLLLGLLFINLGFFSALLNYLLFVGLTALISNNVVLVSLTISGQVIFSIVSIVTTACIVNKYFLNRKFIIYDIVDANKEGCQNTIVQLSHMNIAVNAIELKLKQ